MLSPLTSKIMVQSSAHDLSESSRKGSGRLVTRKSEVQCCKNKWKRGSSKSYESNLKFNRSESEMAESLKLAQKFESYSQNSDFALEAFYPCLLPASSSPHHESDRELSRSLSVSCEDDLRLIDENMKKYRSMKSSNLPSFVPDESQTLVVNFSELLRVKLQDAKHGSELEEREQKVIDSSVKRQIDLFGNRPVTEEKSSKSASSIDIKKTKPFQKRLSEISSNCDTGLCDTCRNTSTMCSCDLKNKALFDSERHNRGLLQNNSLLLPRTFTDKKTWLIPTHSTVNYMQDTLDFVLGIKQRTSDAKEQESEFKACSPSQESSKTFIALGTNGTAIVSSYLESLGWQRLTDKYSKKCFLKWVESRNQINYRMFQEGEQMVNHLPSTCHLSNKILLLSLLRELNSLQRPGLMKLSDVFPETYRMDVPTEYEAFKEVFKDGDIWICKPASLNQGKGIFLVRRLSDVTDLVNFPDKENSSCKIPPRIIQRYVNEPLLLNGRKADIRSYMLIASTAPYLILFNPGYVRLSCSHYDVSSNNMFIHLTNQCMQRKDPRYSSVKESTVWSMVQLNEYINENVAKSKNLDNNWVFTSFMPKMRRAMLHCFIAGKKKLESRVGYFELLGFDFLIDSKMKVWLLEINVNPSFATNCRVLQDLIPALIRESLDISIECFEKNRYSVPLLPLQSLKKFSVLYCGENSNEGSAKKTVVPPKNSPIHSLPLRHSSRKKVTKKCKTCC